MAEERSRPPLNQEQIDDINFYLEEGEKLLNDLEKSFAAFLANPGDFEKLKVAYRMAHTIKGNSGFVNLADLVTLSHAMEDVLNLLHKKEIDWNPGMKPPLEKGIRAIRELFNELGVKYHAELKDRSVLEELSALKKKGSPGKGPAEVALRGPVFAPLENFLLAQVGDSLFALSREFISETRPRLPTVTIPLCEFLVSRVGFLGNRFLPVIEIAGVFNLPPQLSDGGQIFIIVEVEKEFFCLRLEKLSGFLTARREEIIPTTPTKYADPRYFSLGLVRTTDGAPIEIIDIRKMVQFIVSEKRAIQGVRID